jgi:hypothetical protein
LVPNAWADEWTGPTTQAVAYNADWVPYLDPPEKPAAVCLVDSGVAITPDTPADSPEGPIVKRLALDGGSGTAAGTNWDGLHGTRMALVAAAPRNQWGAVGFWPGARIISIRAMPNGGDAIPFQTYADAVFMCATWRDSYDVVAINLSLACRCEPTESERRILTDRITRAHVNDISVVAAAGNNAGAVASPAAETGVLAVAAADPRGDLCAFSNRGSDLDLIAPGCGTDLADPTTGAAWTDYSSGTSGASITASTALALIRSYRSDLTWHEAEALIAESARLTPAGRVLDVEAMFRRAGLGGLVDAAKERQPSVPPQMSSVAPAGTNAAPATTTEPSVQSAPRFPRQVERPRIRSLQRRGRRLSITLQRIPAAAKLLVTTEERRGEFRYRARGKLTFVSRTVAFRLPARWRGGRIALRFRSPQRPRSISQPSYVRVGP